MAATNVPPLGQGQLNRARASVQFATNSQLNVISANLGKGGIVCRPISESSVALPTMTGIVTSPEPYQMYEVTIHLLRTQGLATAFKTQIETLCDVGDITVKSDSANQPDYQIANCTIVNGSNPSFAGTDPEFQVVLHGAYAANSSLFNVG
jgi:hypothetical protein